MIECFTFLRMGGSHDRIEIDLITDADNDSGAARQELKTKLASFDAAKAKCFLEKDRQRLLAVVEAGSATSNTSTSRCVASSTSVCCAHKHREGDAKQ